MKNADFIYQGKGTFDQLDSDTQLTYEKHKYIRGILPQLKELEKEIKQNKRETNKEKKETFDFLMQTKSNHRSFRFEYENGDVYPKEVSPPDIRFIQYAEPHVIITDWYDENPDWYRMHHLIKGFAEESYLSYEMGFWYSSIASAINCCEYVLKYELLRKINFTDKSKAKKLSEDRGFTLGSFIKNVNYLEELNLKSFLSKIQYLNDVRIAVYHFSPKKSNKLNKNGELEVEQDAPISDEMVIPIVAYRIYSIMYELTSRLYNQKKSLIYIKEGIKDWMKKRKLKEGEIKI